MVNMNPPNSLDGDQDLVDRIFDYLLEGIPALQEAAAQGRLSEMKVAVRREFAGDRQSIGPRSGAGQRDVAEQVLALFNGQNATEVARRLGISRATVYRRLKQAGVFRSCAVDEKYEPPAC